MWTIRPAGVDEGPALSALALRAKASWGYAAGMLAAFASELTLDQADVAQAVVADEDGQAVGFYGLEAGRDGGLELAYLFVEPRRHRSGIGASLLQHAIERARDAGHERLVIQGDPNAAPFYERVGATRIGQRESASVKERTLPLFEITW